MDKRTRVLNAMNKKEVDHVPVGFWFHFAGEEASGQGCINAHLKNTIGKQTWICENYVRRLFPVSAAGNKNGRGLESFKTADLRSSLYQGAGGESQSYR